MSHELLELAQRLINELGELAQIVERVKSAWRRFQRSSDSLYLDSVALNLHSFYNGLEHLFELIAIHIDDARPEGTNWHQTLLGQMASEIPQVRPAVISELSHDRLNDYRRFRHIVRHTYTFQFDAERIRPFIEAISMTFAQVQNELTAFAAFLQDRA
ncbi:MAG: hypothetical protein LH702_07480 [Phormidesmis sp. CAN_BIN44]|nr:hypothetical protein [Phormidesmis sp. CAN_BIN44]